MDQFNSSQHKDKKM